MNSDTKKKIEDQASGLEDNYDWYFIQGAEFGHNLTLKDAEVLVKALKQIENCMVDYEKFGEMLLAQNVALANMALEQWRKVTE